MGRWPENYLDGKRDEVIALYVDGFTIEEITKTVHSSTRTIRRILKDADVPVRDRMPSSVWVDNFADEWDACRLHILETGKRSKWEIRHRTPETMEKLIIW